MLSTLGKISANNVLKYFSDFSQQSRFLHLMQIVSIETICINCQNLFSRENKKNISISCLLKILPGVLSVKKAPIGLPCLVLQLSSQTYM